MKLKKTAAVVLSAVMALSVMVGCADDEDSSSKKSKKDDSSVSVSDDSADESKDDSESDSEKEKDPEDSSEDDTSSEDENSKDDSSEDDSSEDDSSKSPDSKIDTSDFYVEKELVGKWEGKYMTVGDTTYTKEYNNLPINQMRFEFFDDNTGYALTSNQKRGVQWSMKDGSGFVIQTDKPSDNMIIKLKDGELIATQDKVTIRFKKVDEFTEVDDDDTSSTSDKKFPSDGTIDKSYVGKWDCAEFTYGDDTYTGDQVIQGLKISEVFTFEFRADGKGIVTSKLNSRGEVESYEFKWTYKDGKVYADVNGDTTALVKDGELLIFKNSNVSCKLKKQG